MSRPLPSCAMPATSRPGYRLGVLLAYCRRYDEAYRLLKGYDDLNCAIVALCLGRNDEAAAMMERIGDTSPLAEYIRAVVAAVQAMSVLSGSILRRPASTRHCLAVPATNPILKNILR